MIVLRIAKIYIDASDLEVIISQEHKDYPDINQTHKIYADVESLREIYILDISDSLRIEIDTAIYLLEEGRIEQVLFLLEY